MGTLRELLSVKSVNGRQEYFLADVHEHDGRY